MCYRPRGEAEVGDELALIATDFTPVQARSRPTDAEASSAPLRASSYTIYVDLPNEPDAMLLVHGYSGAYDKVSRRVATFVRSLEATKPPRPLFGTWSPEPPLEGVLVPPSDEAIATLKRRGYLTTLTVDAEEQLLIRIAEDLHRKTARLPSYIFMPTYDCNLRCFYCFQDHMRTNPKFRPLLRTMDPATIDRIFAALPAIEARHGLTKNDEITRSIGFFGGEPLLEASRPAVERIIRSARTLGPASFWAVTNGTELDAYRDLLDPSTIRMIQITLDGPPREHDRRRIYADGSGSFERIAENITWALAAGVIVQVRLNVDRLNIDQLPELADAILARGWQEHRGFTAYTAPIQPANEKTDAKTTFSSWELDKSLNEMRQRYSQMSVIDRPDDRLKQQARRIFDGHVEPQLKSTVCGAHNGMYIFDAFGDIYACWERTGDPQVRIGRVLEDGNVDLGGRLAELWRSRNVTTNPICLKCRYNLYCGGGCAVLAEGQHAGQMMTNYCDGFAARFRSMVAEAYVEHTAGTPLTTRDDRVCDL
jgi:uncharacterized protein